MPRPPLPRRIHGPLEDRVFKPRGIPTRELETASLTLDGLEALRLADVEGLYQDEAATRMGVSRPTFARILSEARRTVAGALVHGRGLAIGGGPVTRGRSRRWPCPVHGEGRRRGRGCRCLRFDNPSEERKEPT